MALQENLFPTKDVSKRHTKEENANIASAGKLTFLLLLSQTLTAQQGPGPFPAVRPITTDSCIGIIQPRIPLVNSESGKIRAWWNSQ
jgi:hypothetical protein